MPDTNTFRLEENEAAKGLCAKYAGHATDRRHEENLGVLLCSNLGGKAYSGAFDADLLIQPDAGILPRAGS